MAQINPNALFLVCAGSAWGSYFGSLALGCAIASTIIIIASWKR